MRRSQKRIKAPAASKRRGRPPTAANPEFSTQDEVIARTVYRFVRWGFKQRDGIYEVVATAAHEWLSKSGRSIGAHRVEQIYEAWRDEQAKTHPFPPLQPHRYKRKSLRVLRPREPLEVLARALLSNGGLWPPEESGLEIGYVEPTPELTTKALRDLLDFPLPARMRKGIEQELRPRPRGRPRKNPKSG